MKKLVEVKGISEVNAQKLQAAASKLREDIVHISTGCKELDRILGGITG